MKLSSCNIQGPVSVKTRRVKWLQTWQLAIVWCAEALELEEIAWKLKKTDGYRWIIYKLCCHTTLFCGRRCSALDVTHYTAFDRNSAWSTRPGLRSSSPLNFHLSVHVSTSTRTERLALLIHSEISFYILTYFHKTILHHYTDILP